MAIIDLPSDPSLPPGVARGMINRYGYRERHFEEDDERLAFCEEHEIAYEDYDDYLDDLYEQDWADEVERLANETGAIARTGEAA